MDRSGEVLIETDPKTLKRVRTEFICRMTLADLARDPVRIQLIGALGAIRHPQSAGLVTAEIRRGYLVISTEAAEGRTTRELLRREPPYERSEAQAWLEMSAVGLTYAMDHGIYHPRFSLDSIVLTQRGEVKVIGLGVEQLRTGRVFSPEDPGARDQTETAFERVAFALLAGARKRETKLERPGRP